ncbi:mitochondrial potassium channel ATP-binding subunit [Eublepharis macularius]|uniref:Mitochondrial potassium channel ATP-binding subunit n=1 Tax=Eublepharis macularius TaxID=481883 RepID=A0AA97L969_EUBMA|nr:mitochondrial potassium channel ATP-binding subunit [Eublepharis macularius]
MYRSLSFQPVPSEQAPRANQFQTRRLREGEEGASARLCPTREGPDRGVTVGGWGSEEAASPGRREQEAALGSRSRATGLRRQEARAQQAWRPPAPRPWARPSQGKHPRGGGGGRPARRRRRAAPPRRRQRRRVSSWPPGEALPATPTAPALAGIRPDRSQARRRAEASGGLLARLRRHPAEPPQRRARGQRACGVAAAPPPRQQKAAASRAVRAALPAPAALARISRPGPGPRRRSRQAAAASRPRPSAQRRRDALGGTAPPRPSIARQPRAARPAAARRTRFRGRRAGGPCAAAGSGGGRGAVQRRRPRPGGGRLTAGAAQQRGPAAREAGGRARAGRAACGAALRGILPESGAGGPPRSHAPLARGIVGRRRTQYGGCIRGLSRFLCGETPSAAAARPPQPAMLARLLLLRPGLFGSRGCYCRLTPAAKDGPTRAFSVARSFGSHARFSKLRQAPDRLARLSPAVPLLLPRSLFPLGRAAALLAGVGASFYSRALCQEAACGEPAYASAVPEEVPAFDWATFWKFLRPQLLALAAAVMFALGVALLNVQVPLVLGEVVNVVARYTHLGDYLRVVRRPAMRLLSIYALQGTLTFGYIMLLSRIGERVANSMRKELFNSLIRQDVAFFDANRTGQLVNRLTSDIQEFKSSFKMVISQGLRSLTQTAGCLVSLYFISPKLTGLLLVVMPALVGTGALIGSFLRQLSRKAQEQVAKATAVADEALGNVRTVRAFAMEGREIQQYAVEVDRSGRLNMDLGLGIAVFQGLSNLALNCIVLGTLFVGGFLMAGEELSPGDLMSFLVSTQTVQRSMANMSILFGQVVRGMSAGARVFEYMTLAPETPLCGGQRLACSSLCGNIQFQNVCFSYPTRPGYHVLRDFCLSIPSNKTVAIVGQSGGGKSTVAALLERFYNPTRGTIFLDGHDISTLDPSWLRGEVIGFINQEPVLFSTSIMENIRFGKPGAPDAEVYAAARLANADSFIRSFPEGYNTVVGERGVTLSGGQKQRVAIARALIKNPTVLILDEATSALDAESEHAVQEALDRAVAGRTVLVIAHRLSTVQAADLIVVLAKGCVVEAGSHAQLLRQGGLYAELIRRQTKEDAAGS